MTVSPAMRAQIDILRALMDCAVVRFPYRHFTYSQIADGPLVTGLIDAALLRTHGGAQFDKRRART